MRHRLTTLWLSTRQLAPGLATGFAALTLLPLSVFATLLALVNPGRILPGAPVLHALANHERLRIGAPVPEVTEPTLRDPVTRRNLLWLPWHAVANTVVSLFVLALPLASVNALLVPTFWWLFPADDPIASPYPVTSWGVAATMPLVAVVYAVLALTVTPWITGVFGRTAGRILAVPTGARLAQRVAELTASRAAALEAHGAELRRIERDLHDGTQNKLVAVAMHLGIVERELRRDPDNALPLVLRAQDAATDALSGLRDVVRGIYPPVLAERGLDGAIAGLIARCPVPCALTTLGPLRAPAAVESAAYFVVAEALTNIAKHSGAQRASVTLTREDTLTIEITDDGHGGADETTGTGLAGIRRRVAAFEGRTEVTSPPGGPTLLRVELPCGS